jgi:hypothetical protein
MPEARIKGFSSDNELSVVFKEIELVITEPYRNND